MMPFHVRLATNQKVVSLNVSTDVSDDVRRQGANETFESKLLIRLFVLPVDSAFLVA